MHARTFLPTSKPCFVCGEENPAGLHTRFYIEDGAVKARLNAQPHHCGYPDIVHGGVVAALLDECMGWAAARAIGRMCLTTELKLRYLKPVPADREMTAVTKVLRAGSRLVHVQATLAGADGVEYVRAEGRFFPLSAEETLLVDDGLLYRGDEERVFDALRASPGRDDAPRRIFEP